MGINYSTSNQVYKHLVFSGGGIKGISYVGALLELDRHIQLYDNGVLKIKSLCGVSAGSIIATLLAVGYKPHELSVIMDNISWKEIANDGSSIMCAVNFVESWGTCRGDYIIKLMGELIEQKTGKCDYTIGDLWKDHGIQLVIVATDMTYQKSVYFYHDNYGNIPIRIAVRMSMSIPLVFTPYKYNDSYFVDGGVLDNYPLHVFDGEYPGDPNARLNLCAPNPHTLGIKITCESTDDKQEYNSLLDYSMSFINTFLKENDRRMMIPSFYNRSIILINPNYSMGKFDLTEAEKENLIEIGKKSVNAFFNQT